MFIALIGVSLALLIFMIIAACLLDRNSSNEAKIEIARKESERQEKRHSEAVEVLQNKIDARNERVKKQNDTIDWLLDQIINHPEHIGMIARAMKRDRELKRGYGGLPAKIVTDAKTLDALRKEASKNADAERQRAFAQTAFGLAGGASLLGSTLMVTAP